MKSHRFQQVFSKYLYIPFIDNGTFFNISGLSFSILDTKEERQS